MAQGGQSVTRAQFEASLHEKARMAEFRGDTIPFLHPNVSWHFDEALAVVMDQLVARLPGAPWRGDGD